MKKLKLFFFIITIFSCISLKADKLSSFQQRELISSLNYLQYSTAKIKMSENKAIAEEIYYSIINELKISALSNNELNFEYTEFLAQCANLKLTQNEKDFIKQLNEKQQKSAYLSAFSNMGAIFVPGRTPHQMIASLVYTTVANGVAIANAKNQMKTQLERDMFYLDQNILRDIFSMQTSLFSTSAKLLAGSPGIGRINENSMNIFIKATKLETAEERKNALCEPELQKNFNYFPPYWFELGNAYQELGENTKALSCYDKFIDLKQTDIVLKDKNYVNLIKNRIQLRLGNNPSKVLENAQKNKYAILQDLNILKNNYLDSEAGEKNIYLSKIYFLLGEYDKSMSCLQYIIASKSTYPDLIEEATNLKILISSSLRNEEALQFQSLHNFSMIQFGNENIDYSVFPKKENSFISFFKKLFGIESKENQGDQNSEKFYVTPKMFCLRIPNALKNNYEIMLEQDNKLYVPHYYKSENTDCSLAFFDFKFKELSEDSKIELYCKARDTKEDLIINLSVTPIKSKVYKAADKAYKRIGSDIYAHNAQVATSYGETIRKYHYKEKNEERLNKKIRRKAERKGRKNNRTKDEINSEITKTLFERLSPDIEYLQERHTAVEESHYKSDDILFSPSIVMYGSDHYLIGISSIYDSSIAKEFCLSSNGDIINKHHTRVERLPENLEDLKIASLLGNRNSMIDLGIAYIEGYNITRNPKEGLRWLLAAVNDPKSVPDKQRTKIAQAYQYLGECYWNGNGVEKDKEHAKTWFLKAKDYGVDVEENYLK